MIRLTGVQGSDRDGLVQYFTSIKWTVNISTFVVR